MRALHVLFDFSLASDEAAGPKTVMAGLLRGWAELSPGDRVTVFGPVTLAPSVAEHGFEMIEACLRRPPRRVLQQQFELPIRKLARVADAVIVPNLACSVAPLGAPVIGTLCDLRHVRRPHEFPVASRVFRRAIWTASARRMSAVVSISSFSLQEAEELGFHLPPLRFAAPLGLDHIRPLHGDTPKRNMVVCVGHRSSKGLTELPSIWATVQNELGSTRPDLIITGVPSDRQTGLIRSLAAAGVSSGFQVFGFLREEVLHRTIAEAKALLYLSAYEGYGFVPSEATVLGTHSFVYDLPPYRERASHLSVTATPVNDISAIARSLCSFLRAGSFEVVPRQAPRWADTAEAYRGAVEAVLRSRGRSLMRVGDG